MGENVTGNGSKLCKRRFLFVFSFILAFIELKNVFMSVLKFAILINNVMVEEQFTDGFEGFNLILLHKRNIWSNNTEDLRVEMCKREMIKASADGTKRESASD